jgi:hypothetical protein
MHNAQVWDFPGDFDFTRDELVYGGQVVSPQVAFAGASALVYVVDAQVLFLRGVLEG